MSLIRAEDRFLPVDAEWIVTVHIDPTWRFLWAVVKAKWRGSVIKYTHKFDGNPFVSAEKDDGV